MTALIGSNASSPVLIHELAHAVHYQLLPQGAKNAKIIELYEAAKQSGRYPTDSYALRNEREFWAVMSTIYLNGSDGYPPFTRARLKEQEPELYALMSRIYGDQPGEKPIVAARATLACYDVKSAGLDPRLSWVNSFACR